MMLLAEPAGRSLERAGNRASRGMIVQDRTRLIGQLPLFLNLIHGNIPEHGENAASAGVEAAERITEFEEILCFLPTGLLYNRRLLARVRGA
ncbi:hypothetical protein SAMN05216316_2524 [Nitrosovibrio sp. Nv6]|nr:hypothetical protein SAMN05216316_2524 [Nitrosovibrio sp. Nv6]